MFADSYGVGQQIFVADHIDGLSPGPAGDRVAAKGAAMRAGRPAFGQRFGGHDPAQRQSAAHGFADRNNIWHHAAGFKTPPMPGTAEPGLHFIRDQDRALLYLRLLGSRHSREIAWKALQRHWDTHVVTMDPAGKQRCVNAASQLSPRDLAQHAIAFLQAKQTPDLKENVAQAIERVRLLSATAERMAKELGDALGRVAQPA